GEVLRIVPRVVIGHRGALERCRERLALPAPNARIRTRAEIGAPVAIDVEEAQRGVVVAVAPTGVIGKGGPVDALRPIGPEIAVHARRIARAYIVLAIAVYVAVRRRVEQMRLIEGVVGALGRHEVVSRIE